MVKDKDLDSPIKYKDPGIETKEKGLAGNGCSRVERKRRTEDRREGE